MQQKGIAVLFKYKSGTSEVQGVSFEKDGMVFKGSAIDRSMSIAGIEKQLRQNQRAEEKKTAHGKQVTEPAPIHKTEQKTNTGIQLAASVAKALEALLQSDANLDEPLSYAQSPDPKKKKKGWRR